MKLSLICDTKIEIIFSIYNENGRKIKSQIFISFILIRKVDERYIQNRK